jgi:hypothetical protein
VYTILQQFGVSGNQIMVGSVPLAAIVLPNIRTGFFIAAFVVMVVRKFRRK